MQLRLKPCKGQTMLEFVLILPLLLFILLALIQFGMVLYAQNILTGAAQDGARAAANADRSIADGLYSANRTLDAGLGNVKRDVNVTDDGTQVIAEVKAEVPAFLPLISQVVKFELKAKAEMVKERWLP
jgi:TadE-like protein